MKVLGNSKEINNKSVSVLLKYVLGVNKLDKTDKDFIKYLSTLNDEEQILETIKDSLIR